MKQCEYCGEHESSNCYSRVEASGCANYKRACAALNPYAKTETAEPTLKLPAQFKLSDLNRAAELAKTRAYLRDLHMNAKGRPILILSGFEIRPDLVETLKPALVEALAAAIGRVELDLADLGVTVD